MAKQDKSEVIEVEGIVEECLPGAMFKVKLPNEHVVMAHVLDPKGETNYSHFFITFFQRREMQ